MIYETMSSRRSVREFRKEMPPRESIERLVAAAVTAPSASNKQPWRFLAVTRRALIEELARAVERAVERIAVHVAPGYEAAFRDYGTYFTRFEAAPVVLVVLWRPVLVLSHLVDEDLDAADRGRIRDLEDLSGVVSSSLAMQNLLLMAHHLGLGASGMTGPLLAADALRELLAVPPSWRITALVPVGYPLSQEGGDESGDEVEAPPRKPVARVLRWLE